MRAIVDPGNALGLGLKEIRRQFQVPAGFPPAVLAAAEAAVRRVPSEHVDRTDWAFVTLDPEASTDLDQAFAIVRSGADLLLHYAIADVAWFVADGDALDVEAWQRGTTLYLPDGKASLYPPALGEQAASLLPDGDRPAIILTIRVAPDGEARLDGAERALIRSRAKLAYHKVRESDLPEDFAELARRIALAENRRGAARIDPPEQQVTAVDGGYELTFRPLLDSEVRNAAMSLAANLAVADAMLAKHTGLFRVMAEPDKRAVRRLRHSAEAFGLAWPADQSISEFERGLDGRDATQAAMMLAIRRAGRGAGYEPWRAGAKPWHSAVAASYAHATAPLRRLADRYVLRAVLAIAKGGSVPDAVTEAFAKLPDVMARADARAAQIERAVIDLAEVVMLDSREGDFFDAIVTDLDERGARIQLCGPPVVARVEANRVMPGDRIRVRLVESDPVRRAIRFERVSGGAD
jgi:exoribonuclease R